MTRYINLQFAIIIFQFSICILHFSFFSPAASAASLPVVPVDGRPFTAELTASDNDWRLTFRADGQERKMSAADLVRWGRCPEQGGAGGLLAADGGWIAARVVSADKQKLTAESDLLGRFSLPLDSLAAIYFSPLPLAGEGPVFTSPLPLGEGPGVRAEGSGQWSVASGQWSVVRAVLQNGDELTGPLLGIDNNAVRLETDLGNVEIATDRIAAIFLPTKPRPAVAPGDGRLRAWLALSDGSRLLADRLMIAGGTATFAALGREWNTRAENLVFLQPLGGRAVYLSDIQPAEYQQTPFVARPPATVSVKSSLAWPWRTDRNVTGGPLRSGGQLYLKGIGVHSAARLVYELSPLPLGEGAGVRAEGPGVRAEDSPLPLGEGPGVRARRFQCIVGIDDSTDGRGSVRFRVLVDGREKYAGPILRGGDRPVPVEVDLIGAKRLELIVDYADRADVLDHADWIEARIVQ